MDLNHEPLPYQGSALTVGARGPRKVDVSIAYGLTAAHGGSKPVPAPAGHLPERKTEDLTPSGFPPTRVRADKPGTAARQLHLPSG
jgi:hypothetical protein